MSKIQTLECCNFLPVNVAISYQILKNLNKNKTKLNCSNQFGFQTFTVIIHIIDAIYF